MPGRDRQIAKFKASLVYIHKDFQDSQGYPVSKNKYTTSMLSKYAIIGLKLSNLWTLLLTKVGPLLEKNICLESLMNGLNLALFLIPKSIGSCDCIRIAVCVSKLQGIFIMQILFRP